MSHHEIKTLRSPGQTLRRKIRVQHIMDVFSERSKGDVTAAASTVHSINMAQIRNHRDLIKGNLKLVGLTPDTYETTNEIDTAELEQKVGMEQKSPDGGTFVSTEVVRDAKGSVRLVSLAFTTQLRDEVRKILGEPVKSEETTNLVHFPEPKDKAA